MPKINVERPVTHSSWDHGKYTTYDIRIDCRDDSCPLFSLPQSAIARRYSEFKWLRKRLNSICSSVEVPNLPPSGCIFTDRFADDFIEKRRLGLEEFILKIFAIPTLLSEAAFHLFVQTDLGRAEMDAYINREWGKHQEVSEVIFELNQRKLDDERDEISSIASCSRWSDASAFSYLQDLDDESTNGSAGANDDEIQRLNVDISSQLTPFSPITGLFVPPTSSELLSPHGSERFDRRSNSSAALRRVVDLRDENGGNISSTSSSSRMIITPENRRTKLYCSNAVMHSSSFDERRAFSPRINIANPDGVTSRRSCDDV